MKLTTITIFFSFLSLLAILYTLNSLKKETMGIRSAIVWLLLWAGIGFFILFPSLLNSAMRLAQMESRMFFILIVSVFILFALLFNMNSKFDKAQRSLSKLAQEMAILNYKIESKDEGEDEK